VGRLLATPGAMAAYARESKPPLPARRFGLVRWMALALFLSLLGFCIHHFTEKSPESSAPPTPQQEAIGKKLDKIHIETLNFDDLPLSEIVHWLHETSLKRDPDGKGINFSTSRDFDSVTFDDSTSLITGMPEKGPGAVSVKISLANISLSDAVKAICGGANQPIDYYIEDYGVVFYPILAPANSDWTRVWLLIGVFICAMAVFFFVNRKTGWLKTGFRKKGS
jgi:hypothetical protein